LAETTTRNEHLPTPTALRAADNFILVEVRALNPPHPSWSVPVKVYFKRASDAWKLVGLERLPEEALPPGNVRAQK
jgi:hypothetical protein